MLQVALIFVLFMIGKDLAYAPAPYGLRAIAQLLCLTAGTLVLARFANGELVRRYWPLWGYLLVVLLEAPFSEFPWFVALQGLSLASAILFFAAFYQSATPERHRNVMLAVIVAYSLVVVGSIAAARIAPHIAYESIFVGGDLGEAARFRGLFSKSGMLGAASGILLGLAAYTLRSRSLKLAIILLAATCLLLTQSRSFWLGALAASAVTLWLHAPWRRGRIVAAGSVALIAVLVYAGSLGSMSKFERFARLDTVANLTGRTQIWEDALEGVGAKMWIGYGFTLGSAGLEAHRSNLWTTKLVGSPSELSRATLHNGFVQSLMDTGVIGTFFYLASIIAALWHASRPEVVRMHPQALFVLLFLCIANAAESVIYSGSVFQSLCFWWFAVFVMSPAAQRSRAAVQAISAHASSKPAPRLDAPLSNLMR